MLKETTMGNQTKKPEFPYFYGNEADSYSFFIVPRILFKAKTFMNVSAEAKLLYSMLVDRMKLSAANDWRDEEGRVYIYFPRSTVMNQLGCGAQKATRLMEELDDRRGVGLITRVRQGLGKPDRIYVRKCILPEMELREHSSEYGEDEEHCGSADEKDDWSDSGTDEASPPDLDLPQSPVLHVGFHQASPPDLDLPVAIAETENSFGRNEEKNTHTDNTDTEDACTDDRCTETEKERTNETGPMMLLRECGGQDMSGISSACPEEAERDLQMGEIFISECGKMDSQVFETSEPSLSRGENILSGGMKNDSPDGLKIPTNNTEKRKTERSNTDRIISDLSADLPGNSIKGEKSAFRKRENDRWDGQDRISEYLDFRAYFEDRCLPDYLHRENPGDEEIIDEIIGIVIETCCNRKPIIRVGGEDKPAEIVRSRLMKIDSSHIQYVLDRLKATTTDIRNIRQYLLTMLYNAPGTIGSYYAAMANHDMHAEAVEKESMSGQRGNTVEDGGSSGTVYEDEDFDEDIYSYDLYEENPGAG